MWTLGFDTASGTVTASLLRNGKLYSIYSCEAATSHSTTLLPAVMNLLSSAGITPSRLSLIGCSAGPGSFTGVRIGTSCAKGLAAPHKIPCVGVSSMEAMAYLFEEVKGIVCPALNARRGNVYTALFFSDGCGNITRITEDSLVAVAELGKFISDSIDADMLTEYSVYVTGDSNGEASASVSSWDGITLSKTPALLAAPSAYGVARCALAEFERHGRDADLFAEERLSPIYLRKSQAERELEEKRGGKID